MDNFDLELALVVDLKPGGDVDDLSSAFYSQFDGVIAQRLGVTHVVARGPGDRRLTTAMAIVNALESKLDVRVSHVDPDLVDMGEVAARLGVTRSNVHQLVTGNRGSGTFPPPLGTPSGHRIWTWGSVNNWVRDNRPGLWDGASCLEQDEVRQLDAWLLERRRRLVATLHSSATTSSSAVSMPFAHSSVAQPSASVPLRLAIAAP